jgi:hypothetical protein
MTACEVHETEVVETIEPSTEFPGWTALRFDLQGWWMTLDVPPIEYTFKSGDRVELIRAAEEVWGLVAIRINDGPRIPLHHSFEYLTRPFL